MTEQPPIQPTPVGALRFNIDTANLEYFDGNQYVNITTDSPENNTGGTRGLVSGGYISANTNAINFVNISTTGDASDFGDLTEARRDHGAVASRVRGVFGIGYASANSNVLDFVTIASTGNATDFGDATVARRGRNSGAGNETRGLFNDDDANVIDYITIATTGNAVDFGDDALQGSAFAGCASQTRALWGGRN